MDVKHTVVEVRQNGAIELKQVERHLYFKEFSIDKSSQLVKPQMMEFNKVGVGETFHIGGDVYTKLSDAEARKVHFAAGSPAKVIIPPWQPVLR